MTIESRICCKLDDNTEGQEETKRRCWLGRMKICCKKLSGAELLIGPLIGFTLFAIVFLNVYAYPNETQATDSFEANKNTSLRETPLQTSHTNISNNHD